MSIINYQMCAFLLATTTAIIFGHAQLLDEDEDVYGQPWPTYSLQNMPKTSFTCRDKILGGYYADPETQCQMFHVCVKLPGIGVQDYRFLCPNTTAFDQELQICANWVDVDCDKATSYYDNNNLNDLYRGVDDSKNAKEEEEESTFHLQRAESGDVRRSKEKQRNEQKSRPRPNYGQASSSSSSNSDSTQQTSKSRPITSYYTPTSSSTSSRPTTTSTTTTERNYYNNFNNNHNNRDNNNYKDNNDDSKQDIDDIFKGSHSSHFFANRHGGREFDEEPEPRPRPNDFNDYNRKTTEAASNTRATPTRAQRISQQTSAGTTATTTIAPSTKSLKKITLHASFNTDFQDYKSTTPSSTPAPTTPRQSGSSITSRFSFGQIDYQTQERIQPTTYNPNNGYRFKSTEGKNAQDFDKETTRRNKPTVAARKLKLGPQESNYINHNEFVELPKAKLQQPQPFQATQQTSRKPAQLEPQYTRPRAQDISRVGNQEPSPFKSSAKPRTFTSRGSITYKATTQHYADDEFHYPTTTSTASPSYGFSKRTTQAGRDVFTPTTFKPTTYKKPYEQSFYQSQQSLRPNQNQHQKQSPIPKKTAPVTAALPTTANPSYNVDENDGQYHPELYENDFPRNRIKFLRNRPGSNSSPPAATNTTTTTAPAISSRQPHGFQQAHSHLKSQQQSAYQKEREQEQEQDLSDEDELFKTAQSLNFGAASINKLRADIYKAEKNSQQYNSQYSPQVAPSSPKTTSRPTTTTAFAASSTTTTTTTSTTRRPTTTATTKATTTTTKSKLSSVEPKKSSKSKKEPKEDKKSKSKRPPYADEDTSYDYAYYDTA